MQKDIYPEISVVIPVKNEATKIRACINGILSQTVPVKEIIVVDSGSTDGTLDILREYRIVRIIEIPGEQFNHGETRNLGVRNATGDFVLLTVGDAMPYDEFWIEKMMTVFAGDSDIVGVCGQQVVPHDKDKNPAEWFRPVSEPKVTKYKFTKEQFNALSPFEKKSVCGWDDVTAMYRRDILVKIPFQYTTYAEDALWAKDAILAGYTIAYCPAARVYHYHLEDAEFSFKRNYTVMYHMYKFFGIVYDIPKTRIIDYLRLVNLLRKAEGISMTGKIKWWKYNMELKRGREKAILAVRAAIERGDDFFDKQHQEICGRPPIPQKT